jgi:hypothetical protein
VIVENKARAAAMAEAIHGNAQGATQAYGTNAADVIQYTNA